MDIEEVANAMSCSMAVAKVNIADDRCSTILISCLTDSLGIVQSDFFEVKIRAAHRGHLARELSGQKNH